jgi:hypothetical protein
MRNYKEIWCEAYDEAKENGLTDAEAAEAADEVLSDAMAAMADYAKELRKYS